MVAARSALDTCSVRPPPASDRQTVSAARPHRRPVGPSRALRGCRGSDSRKGTRRGSAAQGRRHAQLPSGGRGRRHPARVTQDGVPLGQRGQAAVHEDPGWAPPLPGGQDPGTGRRAPGGADGLSWPTSWSPSEVDCCLAAMPTDLLGDPPLGICGAASWRCPGPLGTAPNGKKGTAKSTNGLRPSQHPRKRRGKPAHDPRRLGHVWGMNQGQ